VTVLPAAAKKLSALTSIRFLAALRVAMYHLVNWDHRTYWWRGLMGTPASVSYFFVSSGFLLTYTYSACFDRDRKTPKVLVSLRRHDAEIFRLGYHL